MIFQFYVNENLGIKRRNRKISQHFIVEYFRITLVFVCLISLWVQDLIRNPCRVPSGQGKPGIGAVLKEKVRENLEKSGNFCKISQKSGQCQGIFFKNALNLMVFNNLEPNMVGPPKSEHLTFVKLTEGCC